MTHQAEAINSKEEIISHQQLRTFIGITGFFLPFVLVLGCFAHGDGHYSWQPSISHYYYSKMHFVFVCTLCVLGGFLITYKGKKINPWESRISNLAGYFAFGVAAFPTRYNGFSTGQNNANQYLQLCTEVTEKWGYIHFGCAGLLFACFVVFCLWFFQEPDRAYASDEMDKFNRRKLFYKVCGWGIVVSIVSLALFFFFAPDRHGLLTYTTFFFETTSLLFFGAAWLVKGSLAWKRFPVLRWLIKPLR